MARTIKYLTVLIGLCTALHEGFAYLLKSDVLSSGGTKMTCASYIAKGTLSQVTASSPWLTSAGYKAIIGFWHPFPSGPGIYEKFSQPGQTIFRNFLYQNVPNPAFGSTTINYSIAQKGKVLLEVFNTLGQRIMCLVDQKQLPGVYKVTWNFIINHVPAGVYFYRLKAGNYEKIRKMVVLY